MPRYISFTFLIVGILLLFYGVSASESLGSDLSRMFTGAPTDRTIWFFLGGFLASVIGLFGAFRGPRRA